MFLGLLRGGVVGGLVDWNTHQTSSLVRPVGVGVHEVVQDILCVVGVCVRECGWWDLPAVGNWV